MALTFTLEEAPFNDDTTPENLELIKKLLNEYPEDYDAIQEQYSDDPSYTEYQLIKKCKEYYG